MLAVDVDAVPETGTETGKLGPFLKIKIYIGILNLLGVSGVPGVLRKITLALLSRLSSSLLVARLVRFLKTLLLALQDMRNPNRAAMAAFSE